MNRSQVPLIAFTKKYCFLYTIKFMKVKQGKFIRILEYQRVDSFMVQSFLYFKINGWLYVRCFVSCFNVRNMLRTMVLLSVFGKFSKHGSFNVLCVSFFLFLSFLSLIATIYN